MFGKFFFEDISLFLALKSRAVVYHEHSTTLCRTVGLFTIDTDPYLTGKIEFILYHQDAMHILKKFSFFSLSASISLKALQTKIKQPSIKQLNKGNDH